MQQFRTFHGATGVKTPSFKCRGMGLIPGQGTKILHALWCGQKINKNTLGLKKKPA